MKLISLFAGAGISDVGFEFAGVESIAQVEIDRNANNVRKRHFPHAEHYEDVRHFDGTKYRGSVDVVAGGFPCQDHSVAGDRRGLDGNRGALWWEFLRIVRESKPRFVVGENVPGLLSVDNGRSMRTIVRSLHELGYFVAWRVLDLQYLGVPQRRRRVFIVASLGDASCAKVLFEPDCLRGNPAKGKAKGEEAAPAFGGVPEIHCRGVAATLATHGGGCNEPARLGAIVPFEVCNIRRDESRPGKENMSVTPVTAVSCITALMPGENSHQSQTVIAYPPQVRRLTPVEYERLMGLPDGYTEYGADGRRMSDSARYRMCGNGWAVPQARWIMDRIVEVSHA